tara:strand:- start:1879 stop:2124 length:246 start_codon:yes stop_codon:yes gene_type:complete
MNNRKQRYYDFILDELIDDTRYDSEMGVVSTPDGNDFYADDFFGGTSFILYVMEMYGAKRKEAKEIWGIYKDRMRTIVKNG